jgi:SIT4-associating protein SAP185/190
VSYLSKEDSIKSLLQWVVSGLDELDQQAAQADTDFIDQIIAAPELYPSYNLSVPGPGPGSPPLEPARIAEDPEVFSGLGHGLETQPTDENRSRWAHGKLR